MIFVKNNNEAEGIEIEFDPSMTLEEKINFLMNTSWGFSEACDKALSSLLDAEQDA